MIRRLLTTAAVVAAAFTFGCKDSPASNGTTSTYTRPATAPAQAAGATTAPTTVPAAAGTADVQPVVTASEIVVGDQLYRFPRARLMVVQRDPIVVRLFSDDPPEAIGRKYSGNNYFFEMDLQVDDPALIDNRVWLFKAHSSDRSESANHIGLEGNRRELQPFDAAVSFERAERGYLITVEGAFLMFNNARDPRMGDIPEHVGVRGILWAELEQ